MWKNVFRKFYVLISFKYNMATYIVFSKICEHYDYVTS